MTLVGGLAADSSNVYISDEYNARIRAVSNGIITTIAGGGTIVQSNGDPATQAQLVGPKGIVLDTKGDLVFADGNAIRTVSQGIINTLRVTSGSLSFPQTLAYDVAGNLFITESGGPLVELSPAGAISFPQPIVVQNALSVATDPSANVYVGDDVGHVVWKLTPQFFCSYAVTTPGVQLGVGGTLNLNVTTSAGCNWSATSDIPWILVSSAASVTGNGTVQLTIASNTTGLVRTGSVIIAGQAIPVTQNSTPGPAVVSVTPSSGSGASQTFAFVFSDPAGASDITAAQIGFNTSLAGTNSCWIYYAASTQTIYLANNAGAFASGGLVLGSSGTLQNSQCTINVATSTALLSGNTLTLKLALNFALAFAGAKNIYMYVQNATVAGGFTQEGTWTVPARRMPVSVTPNSGSGSSQTFAFAFSDSAGAADITAAQIGFNTSLAGTNSCWMYYAASTETIYLANNAGAFASGGLVLGSSGTLAEQPMHDQRGNFVGVVVGQYAHPAPGAELCACFCRHPEHLHVCPECHPLQWIYPGGNLDGDRRVRTGAGFGHPQ